MERPIARSINVIGFDKPRHIYGKGPLQSLGLALSMLRVQLRIIGQDGWQFYCPGCSTPCDDLPSLYIRDWS